LLFGPRPATTSQNSKGLFASFSSEKEESFLLLLMTASILHLPTGDHRLRNIPSGFGDARDREWARVFTPLLGLRSPFSDYCKSR
jgi:hypothetical protein